MTNIICYMGGTCGDLVAAMFNTTGCKIVNSAVHLPAECGKFKKPHLFATDVESDEYLASCAGLPAIVSHATEYHLRRNHKFITIGVTNVDDAIWAAKRFKRLHRPKVWDEMVAASGAGSVDRYAEMMLDYSSWIAPHASLIVNLNDILEGNLLDVLSDRVEITKRNKNFYHNWLGYQHLGFKRAWRLLRRGIVI